MVHWVTEWPQTTTEEQEWVMEFQTRASTNCSMEEAQQIMKEDSVGYYLVDCELCTPLLQSWPFRSELLSYDSQPREKHGPGCGIPQGQGLWYEPRAALKVFRRKSVTTQCKPERIHKLNRRSQSCRQTSAFLSSCTPFSLCRCKVFFKLRWRGLERHNLTRWGATCLYFLEWKVKWWLLLDPSYQVSPGRKICWCWQEVITFTFFFKISEFW